MPRLVQCEKLGRELPGLDKPPFPGELGQRIYDHISAEAWQMWQEQSRLVINHYGLNLADPDSRQVLRQQMEEFLFGEKSLACLKVGYLRDRETKVAAPQHPRAAEHPRARNERSRRCSADIMLRTGPPAAESGFTVCSPPASWVYSYRRRHLGGDAPRSRY